MGRDECIAWPNKSKNAQHPTRPDFNGTIRLSGGPGHYFWVALWQNKRGFNVSFTRWNQPHPKTGVAPSADPRPVMVRLLPNNGDPAFSGETRQANIELRPATFNGRGV
jgi:hypothetical protein